MKQLWINFSDFYVILSVVSYGSSDTRMCTFILQYFLLFFNTSGRCILQIIFFADINIGHLNCILKKKFIALSLIVPQNYHDSGLYIIIFFGVFCFLVFGTHILVNRLAFITLYFFFLIYFKSFKYKISQRIQTNNSGEFNVPWLQIGRVDVMQRVL